MPYNDLREYVARLEAEGEIQRITKEVDWNLEAGAIARRALDLKAPAPFFQKLLGFPAGYSILASQWSASTDASRYFAKLALAFDLPPDISATNLVEEVIKIWKRPPIEPVVVSSGPCQEEIHTGDDINLFEFPVPFIHQGIGGRYIGTFDTCISRDPETGWTNWGMYRIMVHDERTLGFFWHQPQTHMALHYRKYEQQNKPMPFAIVLGTEPITPIISCRRLPPQVNEADVIGGIRGKAVELVKCQTVDLEVPATAEIVIEGEILPRERKLEGPFAETPGYFSLDSSGLRAIGKVTTITHRHHPILPLLLAGTPPNDDFMMNAVMRSALATDYLRTQGFPVKMVYFHPEVGPQMALIATQVPFANFAKHLATVLIGQAGGREVRPHVMVFDEDVDVTNLGEAMFALATRCSPAHGISVINDLHIGQLAPFLSREEREKGLGGACAIHDCTWPYHWPKEDIPTKGSFDMLWPGDVQEKVLKNWAKYGF